MAKAESFTTTKLKEICQNEYTLRVLKTIEFIEEIKKGHWALTEDALEDMEVFLHNTEAYEEDNDRHEVYLIVRDRLAAFNAPVKPEPQSQIPTKPDLKKPEEPKLSEYDKDYLLALFDGIFEKDDICFLGNLKDAGLVECDDSWFDIDWNDLEDMEINVAKEVSFTQAGRTYARKLKDEYLAEHADIHTKCLEQDRENLIRLYNGEKLTVAQMHAPFVLQRAEIVVVTNDNGERIFDEEVTLTEKGRKWVESHLEPS